MRASRAINSSASVSSAFAICTITASEGGLSRSCLVTTVQGIEEREVTVGLTVEKGAVIQHGLKDGETVIVNPHVLLSTIRDRIQLLRRVDRSGGR